MSSDNDDMTSPIGSPREVHMTSAADSPRDILENKPPSYDMIDKETAFFGFDNPVFQGSPAPKTKEKLKVSDEVRMSKRIKKALATISNSLPPSSSDMEDVEQHILHRKQQPVEMKCFQTEVRGLMDMNQFVEQSVVLLDIQENTLESIVDRLLDSMMTTKETVTRSELKSLIFSNPEKTMLRECLQGTSSKDGVYSYDQSWLCSTTNVPTLVNRSVGIARLHSCSNLGEDSNEVLFFLLVLCPSSIKGTKTAIELGRTFATLFSDMELRRNLLEATTDEEFKQHVNKAAHTVAEHQSKQDLKILDVGKDVEEEDKPKYSQICRGIKDDIARRLPFYLSDYKDGVIGHKAIQKTISTTFFLYFSVILPAIAFGNLQDDNTKGRINVEKIMIGQVFGGLVFALLAGQPLVVVMTTAPLVLFTKIILSVSESFGGESGGFDFLPFFAMVGLWNSFFVIIYAVFNLSFLMKFSSRSTEEIFSNFISIALTVDAMKHVVGNFNANYNNAACAALRAVNVPHHDDVASPVGAAMNAVKNITKRAAEADPDAPCQMEVSLLYIILMLGTVWLGITLFNFIRNPYLSSTFREILADYALPVAVVVFSLIGSGIFSSVNLDPFKYASGQFKFETVAFSNLSVGGIFFAAILGFSLSILFFMDQNISAAMVNSPENKLKKGNAYHWDLVVVAVINAVLSIFGLPFMHAVLPHSPLHVRCLADVETRVEGGYARDVVTHVRETRLTNIFSNVAIGFSMLFLPYILPFVPKAVLDGLFLYMAVTPLYGNQMFERVTLFLTEQAAYPPNHYVKRVPQRKMHIFTCCQIVQLAILCVFGFTPWPYSKMIFPIVILMFLPVRRLLLPKIIENKYLEAMDPTQK